MDSLPGQAGDGQQVKVTYKDAEGYFTVNMKAVQADERSIVLDYDFAESSEAPWRMQVRTVMTER